MASDHPSERRAELQCSRSERIGFENAIKSWEYYSLASASPSSIFWPSRRNKGLLEQIGKGEENGENTTIASQTRSIAASRYFT